MSELFPGKFIDRQGAIKFALELPEIKQLERGMRRAEQTIRNLGNAFLSADAKIIALNEAANIRADLAPFENLDD